jgi:four helix bundle protein
VVYKLAEGLANEVWLIVREWDDFAKDTVGKQIVRAADSVCANIAEGRGRYNFKDNQRFVKLLEVLCMRLLVGYGWRMLDNLSILKK